MKKGKETGRVEGLPPEGKRPQEAAGPLVVQTVLLLCYVLLPSPR